MNVDHAQLSMNIFDAIVLGIFGLSAIVAFFRGFVREVLSLGAWVGAGLITMYLFPQSTQFMKHHIKSDNLAAGSAALGTYLCALITLSLINSIIIRYVKSGSEVGLIDNLLGLIFGALRGAFIVSLTYLIMSAVIPKDNPPAWLKTSITKNYLQEGAEILAKIAPKYLSNLEDIVKKQKDNTNATTNELEEEGQAAISESEKDGQDAQRNANKTLKNIINKIQQPNQEGSRNGR